MNWWRNVKQYGLLPSPIQSCHKNWYETMIANHQKMTNTLSTWKQHPDLKKPRKRSRLRNVFLTVLENQKIWITSQIACKLNFLHKVKQQFYKTSTCAKIRSCLIYEMLFIPFKNPNLNVQLASGRAKLFT